MAAKNIVYVPILNTNDTHYRYKMPKLIAKVEGSGNGIKTVIPNMADIAKSLHRPPSYPIKYFGYEVGAQVRCDKAPFTVNGAHDADELQKMLYSFIEKFVLCSKCKNPETKLKVKNKTIHQTCFACGHKTTIPDTIKFTKYIINHPPEEDPSYTSSSTSSSSKSATSKTKEKTSKKKSGTHSPTSGDEKKSDGDDEFDEIDDDELVKIMNGLHSIQVQPSADDKKESLNSFSKMILDRKERLNDLSVQKELLNEGAKLGLREMATLALSETLFTDNICEEIKTYRSLLLIFCEENKEAQKYLLAGFEKLIDGIYKDKLINKIQNILYTLYDSDIIEEDTFIEWYENGSDKYVSKDLVKLIHEKANPFIKWLKEAPESDDDDDNDAQQKDNNNKSSTNQQGKHINNNNNKNGNANADDDDDDDFEIEYSHRVSGLVVEQTKNNNNNSTIQNDDGDDINIDDI